MTTPAMKNAMRVARCSRRSRGRATRSVIKGTDRAGEAASRRRPGTWPRSTGRCSCSGVTHDSCRRAAAIGQVVDCAVAERTRAGRTPWTRSTALWAVPPSASTPRRRGIAAISATRKRLQVPISGRRRQVGRRHAAHRVGDAAIDQHQAVVGIRQVATLRQAEMQQGPVQQIAGEIAGERPAGPVGAAHARCQPDDQQSRIEPAETRHRCVEPVGMRGRFACRYSASRGQSGQSAAWMPARRLVTPRRANRRTARPASGAAAPIGHAARSAGG